MSELSAQCDELRTMAESVGLAMPKAATLMMDAADTICALAGGDSPSVPRVIVADEETDCATGFCTCGNCGGAIDPWDEWCRHCGARMED